MKKTLALLLVLVITASVFVSCSVLLEGKWKTTEDIITKELVLNDGNVGTYTALGIEQDIVWTVDGNKITVTATVFGISTDIYKDAEYSIQGDTLTITETNGVVTVYTRVAE